MRERDSLKDLVMGRRIILKRILRNKIGFEMNCSASG